MENPTIDTLTMTRSIRDHNAAELQVLSVRERLEFYRQQAERMNNKATTLLEKPVKTEKSE